MRHPAPCVPSVLAILAAGSAALGSAHADGRMRLIAADHHVSGVTPGDLDRDGRTDLVTASYYGDVVTWFRQLATGGFEPVVIGALPGAFSIAVADLDGDGDDDVISSSTTEGMVRWYENRLEESAGGPPAFETRMVAFIDESEPASISAGDVDGDGTIDVAVAYLYRPMVHVYLNRDGTGNDMAAHLRTIPVPGNGVSWVRLEDMDSDGDLDVVAATPWDGVGDVNYYWFENLGAAGGEGPGFGPLVRIAGDDGLHGAFTATIGDLDGDGRRDLVTMSDWGQNNRTVNWFRRLDDAGAAWDEGRVLDDDFAGSNGNQSVHAADVDGDGRLDVIGGSSFVSPRLVLWVNRGEAQGFHRVELAEDFTAHAVTTADLDGDGRLEIVAGSWGFYTGELRAYTWCGHCPSDVDDDCRTGLDDLGLVLDAWGASPGHPADVDGDGRVDLADLLAVLSAWGPC